MGADEEVPLILGRPFLNTANACIYVSSRQIHFHNEGRKVKFAFNGYNKQQAQANQPKRKPHNNSWRRHKSIESARSSASPRNEQNWQKEKMQQRESSTASAEARMITTVKSEFEHLIRPPMLTKKEDPGTPTIDCSIHQLHFQKTVCDTGSELNLMAKVTYEIIFGKLPLCPTYVQL
jgi:hypothetical protein